MQKCFNDNDILIQSSHNEGKSVVAERSLRTLNIKIHKKIIDNNKKSYLSYLNKLVDEYNNSSNLTEEFERSPKLTKFKVGDRVRITKYRNTFSKGFTEN